MKMPMQIQLLTYSQAKQAGLIAKSPKGKGKDYWGLTGPAGAAALPKLEADLDQVPGWQDAGCALRAVVRGIYEK